MAVQTPVKTPIPTIEPSPLRRLSPDEICPQQHHEIIREIETVI